MSHYRLLKQIGAGGMGKVHLAEDTKLDRTVALKILPAEFALNSERMRRFVREAKTASMLKHPNIAHIYEISEENGIHFIAMEYVEGETLAEKIKRKSIAIAEALDIAIQTADALEEAAAHGIVHRDIKPANMIITRRGQLKLLDFGLAKVAEPDRSQTASEGVTLSATHPGIALGTVPYMSPEQALGHSVDHRTDLFSFGVVLYEMISGRLPFLGKNAAETIDLILHKTPEPLGRYHSEIPVELERIIRKCMEKDAERRYQSARDLRIDLENLRNGTIQTPVTPGSARTIRSVAVLLALVFVAISAATIIYFLRSKQTIHSVAILPLMNATSNPDMEYLSDGITENLINNLAQLPKLKVLSRSSVFRYKGKQMDPVEIGKGLGVSAVLTGRVSARDDILTVSLELVDTKDSYQIWGEQYNRPLKDLLALQNEISQKISDKLRLRLSSPEKEQLARLYTQDPEAYQLYLKGRFQWNLNKKESLKTAEEYFQRAIQKDPHYALAYAGLADTYNAAGVLYLYPAAEIFPKAKESALKALQLDPTLADGHIALGVYKTFYEWDWAGAGKEAEQAKAVNARFAKSLELNTDNTNHFYCFYLDVLGKPEESIQQHRQALEVDPLAFFFYAEMGWSYYIQRQYDMAIQQAEKSIQMDPTLPLAYSALGNAYREKGKYAESIQALQKAANLDPYQEVELGYAYGAAGNHLEATGIIEDMMERSKQERLDPANIGLIYISLGEKDKAFEWLEKGYEVRSAWMTWLKVEPKYDPIRADPRFTNLLRRVGLP